MSSFSNYFKGGNDALPFSYANKPSTTNQASTTKLSYNVGMYNYLYSGCLLVLSVVMFLVSISRLPFFVIFPQSFVFSFSIACVLFHLALGTLHGAFTYVSFLFEFPRAVTSSLFIGSTLASLIFANRNYYIPCLVLTLVQIILFIVSLISYFSASAGLGLLKTLASGLKSRILPF
jgi:Got1/Sft2-like family protein